MANKRNKPIRRLNARIKEWEQIPSDKRRAFRKPGSLSGRK